MSGYLIRRIKLTQTLLKAAKYCLIIKTITSLGGLMFILPGCSEVQLAGITKPYWNRYVSYPQTSLLILARCAWD